MGADENEERSVKKAGRILLTGDLDRAFVDAGDISPDSCEIRPNMLDAIDAASKGEFDVLGVVISGLSGRLPSALKAIRKSSEAKIVLLAQMAQEPRAMDLIATNLADDYLICPIRFPAFLSCACDLDRKTTTRRKVEPGGASPPGPDPATQERIKHLERLATEDDLTGLKNRKYIWEFARQIIRRAENAGGRITLLVFDVDNLKHYNDLYGHLAGDSILRQA
ncbi:MAG: diguanylate cyclase, partial [Sedimentisphaerales bacterium]|nr:diguanylate cyclase [Sedimentisphaerales bacterium]